MTIDALTSIDARPTQGRLAVTFATRMAASHGLNTFLVWVAFTSHSLAAAGWVLVARAVAALAVPLAVGHLHDRGGLQPWLRAASLVEALAAASLAWFGWSGASAAGIVALSLLLGATSSLFDTVVHPMMLGAKPGRLRPHVQVGLSYDVAKVVGSSVVLALIAAWNSPWPVMAVSLLALAGWRLHVPREDDGSSPTVGAVAATTAALPPTTAEPYWRAMPMGPVVALSIVALLPGQAGVLQVALAGGSFRSYALLGTGFALGAVAGNLLLQPLVVGRRPLAWAYALCAVSMMMGLVAPLLSFVVYGASMAAYYQLTRVVVVESCDAAVRGRVSAAMTAASKVAAIAGSVIAAALVHRSTVLHVGAALVAVVAAAMSLRNQRDRLFASPPLAATNISQL